MSISGQRKVFLDLSLGITSEHFGVSYRLKTHPTPAQYIAFLEVFREVLNLPMLNPEQLNGVCAYRCFVGPGIAVDDLWGDLGGITVGVGARGRCGTGNGILLFVTMEHLSSGELFDFSNSLLLHLHVESLFLFRAPFIHQPSRLWSTFCESAGSTMPALHRFHTCRSLRGKMILLSLPLRYPIADDLLVCGRN